MLLKDHESFISSSYQLNFYILSTAKLNVFYWGLRDRPAQSST